MDYTREKLRQIAKFSERVTHWIGSESSIVWHTLLFIAIFALKYFGFTVDQILLILTTAVSLEAIYLAIFIQMTVNRNTADIEDIQEDVQELGEGVDEISSEVEGLGEEIEEISEDIEELHEDEGEGNDEQRVNQTVHEVTFEKLEGSIQKILEDLETLKNEIRKKD